MKPFTVIDGTVGQRTVVCTWCGSKFADRAELEAHWKKSTRCDRNRSVNNQTQSKGGVLDLIVEQPGEETLSFVRAATCKHETTEKLKDSDGNVIARQCMYCYTRLAP